VLGLRPTARPDRETAAEHERHVGIAQPRAATFSVSSSSSKLSSA